MALAVGYLIQVWEKTWKKKNNILPGLIREMNNGESLRQKKKYKGNANHSKGFKTTNEDVFETTREIYRRLSCRLVNSHLRVRVEEI